MDKNITQKPFWALRTEEALNTLATSAGGLSEEEAQKRLKVFGKNTLHDGGRLTRFKIAVTQFKSPLIFILIIAGALTLYLREWVGAEVIFLALIVNAGEGLVLR